MSTAKTAIRLSVTGGIAVFFCIALLPVSLQAQDVEPLGTAQQRIFTLESAVQGAVAWHPSIDRAVAALSARGQEIEGAKAGYRPQISGGIGPGLSVLGGTSWRPRATLSGSQMLFDFGKVGSSVAAARAGERVSRAELLLAVDGLARDTSFAVIETQRYHALLAVAHEQLESLNAINELVQLRVGRGASPRSDGSQAAARINSARATILRISAELQRWRSNLRYLLGPEEPVDVVADSPAFLTEACWINHPNWDEVPAIMQSIAQRDEAQAAYRGARAAKLPTVSLGADVDTDIRDPFSQRNDVSVGINISSGLYQGGARKSREQASFYVLQSANAMVETARLEAGRSLAEGQEQIGNLKERIDVIGQRRVNMQQTGMLYRLQYFELGTKTLLDLLNAEQELHQTRFEEVNAENDMRRLNVECLYNSGELRNAYALNGTVVRGVTL